MPKKSPRVSVLTPIYNTNPVHLREMIESILNQTFADFEFLILNDSPNNKEIEKIVREYAKHDKRIKYIRNEKNMGITPSRNKLLKIAAGEYLAIFDHDDISMPTRLEQQVTYLDANPDVGVVSGVLEHFGTETHNWPYPEFDTDIRMFMCDNCVVAHTAAMIRKSVLIDNNIEYEQFYSPAEDYRLWSRLMDVTRFHNIQNVLVRYRWTGDNTTKRQQTKMNMMHKAVQLDIINRFPAYYKAWLESDACTTRFRLSLFGIPIFKIKHNKVMLFGFIPVGTIKWR